MSVPGDLSELDAQIEEIFDRADDLMINKKEYTQAVSAQPWLKLHSLCFTKKFCP